MERLKQMKESLIGCVQGQINGNLSQVSAEELGAAVDMIKDLEEAIYYCTITKAMNEKPESSQQHVYHYTERYYPDYPRDMDREMGRMYYNGNGGSRDRIMYSNDYEERRKMYTHGNNSGNGTTTNSSGAGTHSGTSHYQEDIMTQRDHREGKSPLTRRMYMEGKENHRDKTKQMQELETYMQELAQDLSEMVQGASPEERQLLQKKVATLATKINQ